MKSLLHYISEATVSTKYIDQLRTFIQDQRDNYPERQLMFPELIKPWGTGMVRDLVSTGIFGSHADLDFRKKDLPVIGVTKFEGKVYIILKYLTKDLYTMRGTIHFDDLVSDGYDKYTYTYVLCDISDRYGNKAENVCISCDLFSTYGSSVKTKNTAKPNNEIYIRRASLHISSFFNPKNDRGITEEEARRRFEAIQKARVELYTIDLKQYKDLVDKSDNAPVKNIWNGDIKALYDLLLNRGKIMRELNAWKEELSTKVKWYAKNKVGLKSARLKRLSDGIDEFYKDLTLLRDRIREANNEIEFKDLKPIYDFTAKFDELLSTILGNNWVEFRMKLKLNEVDDYKLENAASRFHALIKQPFVYPYDDPADAPSFEMESKCPVLMGLIDILYNIEYYSEIYSVYQKYLGTIDK